MGFGPLSRILWSVSNAANHLRLLIGLNVIAIRNHSLLSFNGTLRSSFIGQLHSQEKRGMVFLVLIIWLTWYVELVGVWVASTCSLVFAENLVQNLGVMGHDSSAAQLIQYIWSYDVIAQRYFLMLFARLLIIATKWLASFRWAGKWLIYASLLIFGVEYCEHPCLRLLELNSSGEEVRAPLWALNIIYKAFHTY